MRRILSIIIFFLPVTVFGAAAPLLYENDDNGVDTVFSDSNPTYHIPSVAYSKPLYVCIENRRVSITGKATTTAYMTLYYNDADTIRTDLGNGYLYENDTINDLATSSATTVTHSDTVSDNPDTICFSFNGSFSIPSAATEWVLRLSTDDPSVWYFNASSTSGAAAFSDIATDLYNYIPTGYQYSGEYGAYVWQEGGTQYRAAMYIYGDTRAFDPNENVYMSYPVKNSILTGFPGGVTFTAENVSGLYDRLLIEHTAKRAATSTDSKCDDAATVIEEQFIYSLNISGDGDYTIYPQYATLYPDATSTHMFRIALTDDDGFMDDKAFGARFGVNVLSDVDLYSGVCDEEYMDTYFSQDDGFRYLTPWGYIFRTYDLLDQKFSEPVSTSSVITVSTVDSGVDYPFTLTFDLATPGELFGDSWDTINNSIMGLMWIVFLYYLYRRISNTTF